MHPCLLLKPFGTLTLLVSNFLGLHMGRGGGLRLRVRLSDSLSSVEMAPLDVSEDG